MPALRLKTELVLAITAMVVAIVATLSTLHVSEVVQQLIEHPYSDGDFIGREVFEMARNALETNVNSAGTDPNDPKKVESAVERVLQRDAGLNSLLKSVLSGSPTIYDVAITNPQGRALVHTRASNVGTVLKQREDFSSIVQGGHGSSSRSFTAPTTSMMYACRWCATARRLAKYGLASPPFYSSTSFSLGSTRHCGSPARPSSSA